MSILRKIISKESSMINWRYAIGEVILIVLGILVAVWINDLAKGFENRKLEKQYLQALREDIKKDTTFYGTTFRANAKRIENAHAVMRILDGEVPFPADTLQFLTQLFSTMSMDGDRPTNRWNELKAMGNLRLLRDRKLVDQLFDYYSLRESNQVNSTQYFEPVIRANRELVNEIFPLETFQELSVQDVKTIPSGIVFEKYVNHPDVRRNWKRLIVRATLQNARMDLIRSHAEQVLKAMKN